jgi:hypothetical protein
MKRGPAHSGACGACTADTDACDQNSDDGGRARATLEQRADLAEQRVAGAVAAGVVDDLELVEVDVAERVRGLARLGALQRPLEPGLELAPVDEPGQHVVARVVRESHRAYS